jgi:hypothetical protein
LHKIGGGRFHVWVGLISGTILNISQVGDEKADHNILAIVQTALFPDAVKSYSEVNVKNCSGSLAKS